MPKRLRILRTNITNAAFNLATENWILRDLDPETHTLYLWRNDNTVVIGSYQNPWVECKVDKMEADGVYLARRQSGGGAVFHDLGNTNFTFLSSSADYSVDNNFKIIIKALGSLGINAERSGRNDLLVDGKKISGSAFRRTQKRSFHHGTLLIGADLTRLADYLNPNPLKLEAKGIKSVRSRVANLNEFHDGLEHEAVSQAVIEAFCDFHGATAQTEWLEEDDLRQVEALNGYYETFADWNWRFGKTPQFSHQMETRFEWGIVTAHLQVEKAVVTDATIYSDALDTDLIGLLQSGLPGAKYSPEGMALHFDALIGDNEKHAAPLGDVRAWMAEQIRNEDKA